MAKYQIPENHIEGFEALSKLSFDQVKHLSSILCELPVGTGPKNFQEKLVAKAPFKGTRIIANVLFSLGGLLTSEEESIGQLAKDLTSSYNESRHEALSKVEETELEEKLKTIFSDCKNLKLTFKALTLQGDNDQIYRDARILSDIRLVFDENIEESNRNAVIIHRLKIEYTQGSDRKVFYTSLDALDLKKLKEQVERALEKEKLIKSSYPNISFIEVSE